jgi:hypothetical protein
MKITLSTPWAVIIAGALIAAAIALTNHWTTVAAGDDLLRSDLIAGPWVERCTDLIAGRTLPSSAATRTRTIHMLASS